MTEEELSRLDALAAAATPGPWVSFGDDGGPYVGEVHAVGPHGRMTTRVASTPEYDERDRDVEFIAASREAVPALVAEVRLLRQVIADMQADGYTRNRHAEAMREMLATFDREDLSYRRKYADMVRAARAAMTPEEKGAPNL